MTRRVLSRTVPQSPTHGDTEVGLPFIGVANGPAVATRARSPASGPATAALTTSRRPANPTVAASSPSSRKPTACSRPQPSSPERVCAGLRRKAAPVEPKPGPLAPGTAPATLGRRRLQLLAAIAGVRAVVSKPPSLSAAASVTIPNSSPLGTAGVTVVAGHTARHRTGPCPTPHQRAPSRHYSFAGPAFGRKCAAVQ